MLGNSRALWLKQQNTQPKKKNYGKFNSLNLISQNFQIQGDMSGMLILQSMYGAIDNVIYLHISIPPSVPYQSIKIASRKYEQKN